LWSDVTKKNTYYKLHLGMMMRSLPFLLLAEDADNQYWNYNVINEGYLVAI
jgi:hypothetical protein